MNMKVIVIYSYQMHLMKPILILVILGSLLEMVRCPWGSLCSVICGTGCNGDLSTNCNNKCQSDGAWTPSGNTCVVKTSANWHYLDGTSDLNGTLTVTGATLSAFCYDFYLYGYVNPASTLTVSTTGITVPYFAMRIYVGILAHNSICSNCGSVKYLWSSSTTFSFLFNDPLGTQSASNPFTLALTSNPQTFSGKCDNQNKIKSNWFRVTKSYTYNSMNTPLNWKINCNEPNSSAQWGIRQFLIIYQSCHWACASCFGSAVSQCNSCVQNATNKYWLSGTTCNQTCLSSYGYSTPYTCIYCDKKCVACNTVADNCSACTTFGVNASFLSTTANPSYPTCVTTCPPEFFGNKTTRTCDPCNINCTTCVNNANYCTSCIGGYYWAGWTCYSPCPQHYFLDPNGTNCTKCYPFCDTCVGSYNICTICISSGTYKAYLLNTTSVNGTCERVCPAGYYETTNPNLCLQCNSSCTLCSGDPSPCSQCAAGFYLINSACSNSCPNGTFASNSTGSGKCLNCDVDCVDLTINMYFSSIINDQMYIDMIFSQALESTFNLNTFQDITITSENIQYTLDMFTVTYVNLSSSSYRIIIVPKTFIFLYNATFTITTEAQPNPRDQSTSMMPFKASNYLKTASLNWFLIKGPPFTALEIGIMKSFSTLSSKTNNLLGLPYLQQIKKSGVFSLLFGGAQATSLSMLSNQIQSQNLYEGVRIWAIFVFFDAPPYQQISNQTKRFVAPTVEDRIRNSQQIRNRGLFSTDSMYWRFQRTGQTSFFIYDVYIPIFLILLCWAGMAIAHFSQEKRWYIAYAPNIYSAVHKIHQISLMYIAMAAIVQFIYFSPTSFERNLSAIMCVAFNIYFLIYQLYIYYDMIKYPLAQIGNKFYDYYVIRYGSFLKNIRFVEYDINQNWTISHFFRPYNYHILSFYKKFLMIIALPLFYTTPYAQMSILVTIQLFEIVRFCNTWPFVSNKRNLIRLSLELSLLLFFLVNIIQIYLLQIIMKADSSTIQKVTVYFYGLGWAGFSFCCYFNISFICIGIYDFCLGLRVSNRVKMDLARKKYYFQKIHEYEKENESSSKFLVDKWVKLGNLNDNSYGDLPEINVRIQCYEIKKFGPKFELGIRKITSLQMKPHVKIRKPNNTTIGGKIERRILLSQYENEKLFNIISQAYRKYESNHAETIIIKTFLNVWQKDFREGQNIPLDRNLMFQKVELVSYQNDVEEIRLESLLDGFPIPPAILQK